MHLKDIYKPIERELIDVEKTLRGCLGSSRYKAILKINNYVLEGKGKRLRPALVLLSAKATQGQSAIDHRSIVSIATAVELIHMASLIHDDVIDHSKLRHNKPTINSKWGQDISITVGDYLYSVAFELISDCSNLDVVRCISSATKAMCEGELLQVCERDNLDLLKERYLIIVRKKTASLFAASCQAGSLVSKADRALQRAFREYGINFGIAFQIINDYLDIVSEEKNLGKSPGQDIGVGEVTLPLLNLLESVPAHEKEGLKALFNSRRDKVSLQKIKSRLFDSEAAHKTSVQVSSYMRLAKKNLNRVSGSVFKTSLLNLADHILSRNL